MCVSEPTFPGCIVPAREVGLFSVYKDLDPDRHSDVKEWGSRDSAMKTVEEARERFFVTAVSG